MKRSAQLKLAISIIVTAATSAQAEPYIGGNIGGNITTISKNVSYLDTTASLSDKFYGFRGQALIGYNFHFSTSKEMFGTGGKSYRAAGGDYSDRVELVDDDFQQKTVYNDEFFFAVELDGAYNSGEAKESINPWFLTTSASVRERQRYNVDFFALAKYRLQPNLILFAGPGMTRGQFSVDTNTQTAGNLGITGDTFTWLNGWTLKAGLEIPIMNSFNLVATYQYANYQDGKWTRVEPLTGENVTVSYSPVVSSVTLGLNWAI